MLGLTTGVPAKTAGICRVEQKLEYGVSWWVADWASAGLVENRGGSRYRGAVAD